MELHFIYPDVNKALEVQHVCISTMRGKRLIWMDEQTKDKEKHVPRKMVAKLMEWLERINHLWMVTRKELSDRK